MIHENELKFNDLPRVHVNLIVFAKTELATADHPSLYEDQDGFEYVTGASVIDVNAREREAVIEVFESDYSDEPSLYTVRCTEGVIQEYQKAIVERLSEMEEELSA